MLTVLCWAGSERAAMMCIKMHSSLCAEPAPTNFAVFESNDTKSAPSGSLCSLCQYAVSIGLGSAAAARGRGRRPLVRV